MGKGKRLRSQHQATASEKTRGTSAPANPFYDAVDRLLRRERFDAFAEGVCRQHWASAGAEPGVAPGAYFRMMLVGFLEGLSSDQEIAWRCQDSWSLREFLGYSLTRTPPDHLSLAKARRLLDPEAHATVFGRALALLDESGLLSAPDSAADLATPEARASMDQLVRRDGTEYEEWMASLAQASGSDLANRSPG